MTATDSSSIARHRARLRRRGVVRLEVSVRKADAELVRGVVRALNDPERAEEARMALRERFGEAGPVDLKALLAAAPLEGIDLTRNQGMARDVDI